MIGLTVLSCRCLVVVGGVVVHVIGMSTVGAQGMGSVVQLVCMTTTAGATMRGVLIGTDLPFDWAVGGAGSL